MLGFMILGSMLFISGAISIFELTKLGKSIKGLIFDNYRSIDYSRNMLDALEQQGNALLLFANGNRDVAATEFAVAQRAFNTNLDSAKHNFLLEEEKVFIDSISISFNHFTKRSSSILQSNSLSLETYLNEISPLAQEAGRHVKNLITINQQGLFNSAAFLETSAQRASIPGLIVIITSIIFTFIFTYLVHHYFVSPIIRLTKGINDFVRYRKPFDVPLETKDEFHSLKESIVNLIALLKSTAKKAD